MINDEFKEIHEAWAELKLCYDEIDECNAQAATGKEIIGFGANAAQTVSAQ